MSYRGDNFYISQIYGFEVQSNSVQVNVVIVQCYFFYYFSIVGVGNDQFSVVCFGSVK